MKPHWKFILLLIQGLDAENWSQNLPPWIQTTNNTFDVPPGIAAVSTVNHTKVVVCLFNLVNRRRYSPVGSDITFNPGSEFDGELCTHVICTRITMYNNLVFWKEDPNYQELPNLKPLMEKYPRVKFLVDVKLSSVHEYIWMPRGSAFVPTRTKGNTPIFLDNVENFIREFGLHGLHINHELFDKVDVESSTYIIQARLQSHGFLLTTDVLMEGGQMSKTNELFDLVMVPTDDRLSDEEDVNFFFPPDRPLTRNNNYVLQVYFFGFIEFFSVKDGTFSPLEEKVVWGYNEVCQIVLDSRFGMELLWDGRKGRAIASNGTHGIMMNTPETVIGKTQFAIKAGLRGVMTRSTHEDDFNSMCGSGKYPLTKSVNYAIAQVDNEGGSRLCEYKYRHAKNPEIHELSPKMGYILINSTLELNCTAIGTRGLNISLVDLTNDSRIVGTVEVKVDLDCPENVTATLKVDAFVNTAGRIDYRCQVHSIRGEQDSANVSYTVMQKPFLLHQDKLWIEEVDLDLNFDVPTGTKKPDLDSVLFCQLNDSVKFFSSPTPKDALYLCSHLILNGLFNLSDLMNGTSQEKFRNAKQFLKQLPLTPQILLGFPPIGHESILDLKASSFDIFRDLAVDGLHFVEELGSTEFPTFVHLIEDIRASLGSKSLLSVALELKEHPLPNQNVLLQLDGQVNFTILLGYSFNREKNPTHHISPFADFGTHAPVVFDVNLLKLRNVVLGIPTSGYAFELSQRPPDYFGINKSSIGYPVEIGLADVCNSIQNGTGWHLFWDHVAKAHFLRKDATWITFVSLRSIFAKLIWIRELKLKGVMMSAIELDDFSRACSNSSILEFIHSVLKIQGQTRFQIVERTITVFTVFVGGVGVFVAIMIITALGFAIIYKRFQRLKRAITAQDIDNFYNGEPKSDPDQDVNAMQLPYDTELEVPANKFTIDKTSILGSGEYGIVYSGYVGDQKVAAKTVKPGAESKYFLSLLSEIKTLAFVGKHEHIVRLIGASTNRLKEDIVYVFVELCPLGNLKSFLRKLRNSDTGSNQVKIEDLYTWCLQISSAVDYLALKRVIHGDLATRNILLDENHSVKLTDFGLARKLYRYNVYQKQTQEPLPWAWMALESLLDREFSIKSDLWSFGVTLWEIFCLAQDPYAGMVWSVDFVEMLKSGLRLGKPEYANESVYRFITQCWNARPEGRPAAGDAVILFSRLLTTKGNYVELQGARYQNV